LADYEQLANVALKMSIMKTFVVRRELVANSNSQQIKSETDN